MLFNAIGLFWTLSLNEDLSEALVEKDGFNCAVNFFDSLSDYFELQPESSKDLLSSNDILSLAEVIWAYKDKPGIKGIDAKRIEGSFASLEFTNRATARSVANSTDLKESLLRSIQGIVFQITERIAPNAGLSKPATLDAETTARILRKAMEKLLATTSVDASGKNTDGSSQFDALVKKILDKLNEYLLPIDDLGARVKSAYEAWKNGEVFDKLVDYGVTDQMQLSRIGTRKNAQEYYWQLDTGPKSLGEAFRVGFGE